MTTTLTIIAFDSDVRCLNANLQHRKAWIVQEFGIVGSISAPLTAKPIVPRIRLFAHEVDLTAEGYANVLKRRENYEYDGMLCLSAGETFGLRLALWRCCSAPEFESEPPDFELQVAKFSKYKIECARRDGDAAEVERLIEMHAGITGIQKDSARTNRLDRQMISRTLKKSGLYRTVR